MSLTSKLNIFYAGSIHFSLLFTFIFILPQLLSLSLIDSCGLIYSHTASGQDLMCTHMYISTIGIYIYIICNHGGM